MRMSDIPKIKYKDFLRNQDQPDRENPNYVDFWKKHIGYCKSGVEVGGVFIPGFLYWHLNFFKVSMDRRDEFGNSERVVDHPDLRDNEWYILWALNKAKENNNKPISAFGTRRFAKTVFITSYTAYHAFIFQKSNPLINGGSAPDINNITKYFDEFYEERPDCFSDLMKVGDWTKAASNDLKIAFNRLKVKKGGGKINPMTYEFFPIKDKPNDNSFTFSQISVRNLEHGQVATKEELLAGITPSSAVWDECGKYHYGLQRAALLPAIENDLGEKRFVELLIGTGGNIEFAIDAEADFMNTDKSGFLHLHPDMYTQEVKEEYFQYKQESDKKVSFFVPAEMSNKGGQKIRIPLSDYLNRDFSEEQLEALEGLEILVTDWDTARERIDKYIADQYELSEDKGKKARMYYPYQPEHCFLYSGHNPFPVEEAKRTLDKLREKGLTGEYVELDIDSEGRILVLPSPLKPIDKYPFQGNAQDAPIVIYERPIFENPREIKRDTYIAGFDGTKIDTSAVTDSVNVIYIYKRIAGVSGFQRQIVASYAARPNQDTKFYRQAMLLLKLYNAECLPEADVNFTKYLRAQNAEHLLAPAKGTNLRINSNSQANTEYGLPATANNKRHLLKLFKNDMWERYDTGYRDSDGNPITELGVERVTDPMLLEEIIAFGNYKNYDRIMAAGHFYIWDEELNINNKMGSTERAISPRNKPQKKRRKNWGRNKKYRGVKRSW